MNSAAEINPFGPYLRAVKTPAQTPAGKASAAGLPIGAVLEVLKGEGEEESPGVPSDQITEGIGGPEAEIQAALASLERLGMVEVEDIAGMKYARLTADGEAFARPGGR